MPSWFEVLLQKNGKQGVRKNIALRIFKGQKLKKTKNNKTFWAVCVKVIKVNLGLSL
jgi:hypothetical protein